MFIKKDYILSNEIAQKGNITIANFSILYNDIENKDIQGVMEKYGACTFINPDSPYIPKYIREIINNPDNKFTDLSDMVLLSTLTNEFNMTLRGINKYFKDYNPQLTIVEKKKFVKFKPELQLKLHNKIINVLDKDDTMSCYKSGDIDDYIPLGTDKFLTWYSVF